MPSPVAHGVLGVSWAVLCLMPAGKNFPAMFRQIWADKFLYGLVIGLALIPDIDYLPGLITGSLNAFHQTTTHSLSWTLLCSVGVLLLFPNAGATSMFRWWCVLWGSMLIHLAADVCTVDLGEPIGFALGWPFSPILVNGPVFVFLPLAKETLREAWQGWNALVLGWEFLLTAPICWMVMMAKRSGQLRPWVDRD